MDTPTLTSSEPASISIGSGTAVTETPAQTTGLGDADSQNGSPADSSDSAGGPQGSSDGTQQEPDQGGRRKASIYDTVKELRAERRETRQHLQELLREVQELRQARDAAIAPKPGTVARDPSKFWQDPEGSIETKLQAIRDELRDSIVGEFHHVRQYDQETSALRAEQEAGAEFIRSQKGYSPQDDEDLIDIIEENGLKSLAPMQAARAAWSILQQSRGVGDKTALKARASGVVGQPPGVGFGKKVWSQSEYDQTLDVLLKNPQKMTPDLEAELLSAAREGRVR